MKQTDIENEKLRLERQRLAIETRLKRQDQSLQQQQFEASRKGFAAWSQAFTPLGAAILAGLVGLFGTVLNGYQNNLIETKKYEANQKLERQKLEGNLILDAIKTAGNGGEKEKQTAANLLFLAESGLITIPDEKLKVIRDKAGDALPSLPDIRTAIAPVGDVSMSAKHTLKAITRTVYLGTQGTNIEVEVKPARVGAFFSASIDGAAISGSPLRFVLDKPKGRSILLSLRFMFPPDSAEQSEYLIVVRGGGEEFNSTSVKKTDLYHERILEFRIE